MLILNTCDCLIIGDARSGLTAYANVISGSKTYSVDV